MSTDYAKHYRNIDFRRHPEQYRIGKGEQGVLIAEPYKSELLPYWAFRTPKVAQESAETIYAMFERYRSENDFVGMDMARKFLQMGYTRARRYANYPSGKKYTNEGAVRPQAEDAMDSPKAHAARIFYTYYERAKNDPTYQQMRREHKERFGG